MASIYPDAGAREWFRTMNLDPTRVQWVGIKTATSTLLTELTEVARGHGLVVDIVDNPSDKYEKEWTVAESGGCHIIFSMRKEPVKIGEDEVWWRLIEVETDGADAQPISVVFDVVDMRWLGAPLEVRDIRVDGAPPVRISAMEEVARFIVETLH